MGNAPTAPDGDRLLSSFLFFPPFPRMRTRMRTLAAVENAHHTRPRKMHSFDFPLQVSTMAWRTKSVDIYVMFRTVHMAFKVSNPYFNWRGNRNNREGGGGKKRRKIRCFGWSRRILCFLLISHSGILPYISCYYIYCVSHIFEEIKKLD